MLQEQVQESQKRDRRMVNKLLCQRGMYNHRGYSEVERTAQAGIKDKSDHL